MTELLNLNFSPQRILELGCGAGRNLKHIEKAFPHAEIFGIDVNPAVILENESESNIKVLQANILDLDWSKLGNFDVIITCGFLMHINHHEIKELVMKIDAHSKWHIHWELHGESHPWDYHRYPRSYQHLFDECGLTTENFRLDTQSNIYMHGLTPKFCHCLVSSKSRDSRV